MQKWFEYENIEQKHEGILKICMHVAYIKEVKDDAHKNLVRFQFSYPAMITHWIVL